MKSRASVESLAEPTVFQLNWAHDAAQDVVRLTKGNDYYKAGDGGETVEALKGDDRVQGGHGDDVLYGKRGDDVIGGFGGRDQLYGGFGNDSLAGDSGLDRLFGGDGNDILRGGTRRDVLCGGAGADQIDLGSGDGPKFTDGARDTVLYLSVSDSTADAVDRIYNFATGIDRFDLSAIDADVSTPEDDAFRFIGSAAFSGVAGELRADGPGSSDFRLIQADVDGDGVADLTIQVVLFGDDVLHRGDFIL